MPPTEIVRLSPHHERIRRRGVNLLVYWCFRVVAQPAIQIYFRLRRTVTVWAGQRYLARARRR